jgi:hypothetical protein
LSKAGLEAANVSVVQQGSTPNTGWHAGASIERQQFSRFNPHPGAAHWRELKKVQEQFSVELQAQAERISKVESFIDLGTLQEAVDTVVTERVTERVGQLTAGIGALRADLQKASKVQQGPEVMSTLQEDSGQELFFHLEEAMERERQSRLKFEDAVMTRLSCKCRMYASQPHVLQELRAQIQTVEEDLRAETCHLSLEKSVAALACTMHSLLGDCPLGLSPAGSVSTTVGVPSSNTSEATTVAPESTRVIADTVVTATRRQCHQQHQQAEAFTDSVCRMGGLNKGRKSSVRTSTRGSKLGTPRDKPGKQYCGGPDR